MDVVARLIAGKLSTGLGGSFYVENVPGASGTLGAHDARQRQAMVTRCFG